MTEQVLVEYQGFVLLPAFKSGTTIFIGGYCEELKYSQLSNSYQDSITEFKKYVDKILGFPVNHEKKDDSSLKEYHKQLDQLAEWANRLKAPALMIRQKLIEIHILFDKILDLSFEDVKRDYFECANKGEKE